MDNAQKARDALHDAFTLGWQVVELQNRLQIVVPKDSADRGLRLPSMWRACFNRIAAITSGAFHDATTANTLYAPKDPKSLPYLFPALVAPPAAPDPGPNPPPAGGEGGTGAGTQRAVQPAPAPRDYADIGIAVQTEGPDKKPILSNFALYEAMRRALNCLVLISTQKEDTLTSDLIVELQTELLSSLPDGKKDAASAQEFLTQECHGYLECWHGYLRENYFTGGQVPNDSIELIAYEAGHAMSALSWELLVQTIPLESKGDVKNDDVVAVWKKVFNDQSVMRVQHQISALSTVLDEAWYLDHDGQKRPVDGATPTMPNPDLPSQSILAVKSSLDYWLAAINWTSDGKNWDKLLQDEKDKIACWRSLRLALTEQANVWQTLVSGRESLRGYNMESAAHKIMQDITDEINSAVRSNFKATAEAAIETFRKEAIGTVNGALGSAQIIHTVAIGAGVAVLAGSVILLSSPQAVHYVGEHITALGSSTAVTGFIAAIASGLKLPRLKDSMNSALGKLDQKPAAGASPAGDAAPNLLTSAEGAVQSAEETVLKAFERAYAQMRIELDGLNRSIALSYPLVEFFVRSLKLNSNVDFLTDIFWSGTTREEEIGRVIKAAFGALALMGPAKS